MKQIARLALIFGCAASAYADVKLNLDALAGRRWTLIEDNGYQANEYAMASHYSIADLPVAVGGQLSLLDFRNEDFESNGMKTVDTAFGYEVSLEAKAWVPESVTKTDAVVPYAKFSQILLSSYEIKGSTDFEGMTVKSAGEASGYQINLGANFKYNDRVNFLAEYSTASKSLKLKTKVPTANGRTASATSKPSFDSRALLFGAQVKI